LLLALKLNVIRHDKAVRCLKSVGLSGDDSAIYFEKWMQNYSV